MPSYILLAGRQHSLDLVNRDSKELGRQRLQGIRYIVGFVCFLNKFRGAKCEACQAESAKVPYVSNSRSTEQQETERVISIFDVMRSTRQCKCPASKVIVLLR